MEEEEEEGSCTARHSARGGKQSGPMQTETVSASDRLIVLTAVPCSPIVSVPSFSPLPSPSVASLCLPVSTVQCSRTTRIGPRPARLASNPAGCRPAAPLCSPSRSAALTLTHPTSHPSSWHAAGHSARTSRGHCSLEQSSRSPPTSVRQAAQWRLTDSRTAATASQSTVSGQLSHPSLIRSPILLCLCAPPVPFVLDGYYFKEQDLKVRRRASSSRQTASEPAPARRRSISIPLAHSLASGFRLCVASFL